MPSFTETFGLVYAEAMSQGLPVVYTRGQGFDGQFEEGFAGYSVNSNSPEEIADVIEKIIADYSTISANCISGALQFNWKEIAEKYYEIYECILLERTK